MQDYRKGSYYEKSHWEEDERDVNIPLELDEKFERIEPYYNTLCQGVDLKEAEERSLKEREKKKLNWNDFIYGEIVK